MAEQRVEQRNCYRKTLSMLFAFVFGFCICICTAKIDVQFAMLRRKNLMTVKYNKLPTCNLFLLQMNDENGDICKADHIENANSLMNTKQSILSISYRCMDKN